MGAQLITTKKLYGLRVVDEKKHKRIGKVRRFVFHPSERRCIGLLVKRPDAALMFHRKDLFVALNGFYMEDGEVVVRDEPTATDNGAVKALGVKWNQCIIWVGMPVLTESGEFLGYVDMVKFNRETGVVESLTTENGAANDAVLGKRVIPGKMVRGFRKGVGGGLVPVGEDGDEVPDDFAEAGAILVSDDAATVSVEGGAAAMAGKATAVVTNKAKRGMEKTKPIAQEAAKKTGAAVEAGAFAAGKQLGRASGMFAAFKEEYKKASRGED